MIQGQRLRARPWLPSYHAFGVHARWHALITRSAFTLSKKLTVDVQVANTVHTAAFNTIMPNSSSPVPLELQSQSRRRKSNVNPVLSSPNLAFRVRVSDRSEEHTSELQSLAYL